MAHDAGGNWIGYGVGDSGDIPQKINHRLLLAYNTNSHAQAHGVADAPQFTQATADALTDLDTFINGNPAAQAAARSHGCTLPLRTDGVADLNVRRAIGVDPPPMPPGPVCVGITIGGAGSAWNNGYQWDLGEALDKTRMYHQPIGYSTQPIPMNTGVQDGIGEVIRQLDMPRPQFGGRNCTQIPWLVPLAYSMGSIVWMNILMRVLYGDLQRFKPTYMGSNSFGNPMRQNGHAFPGAIPVPGEGIAWTSLVHDTPECHWDFTARKGMIGSPGNDLYADVEGSDLTKADMRAVWHIINTGNPLSLAEAIAMLPFHLFSGSIAAAEAAFKALDFFVVKGLTPHTSYQFVQPIEGDPRDCWRIALDHSADIVARLPMPFAKPAAA